MAKRLIVLSFIFTLSACVSFQPVKLEVVTTNNKLHVLDNRPEKQKETELLSYLITSCSYGIQRLGDEWTSPSKIDFLKSKIAIELPNARELVVNNFVIYNNMQYKLREGNIFRGPIWSLVECDENTDRFTLYTPEENPERENMIIGTLEGTIDGREFSVRVAEIHRCPAENEQCKSFQSSDYAVKTVLNKLLSGLVTRD